MRAGIGLPEAAPPHRTSLRNATGCPIATEPTALSSPFSILFACHFPDKWGKIPIFSIISSVFESQFIFDLRLKFIHLRNRSMRLHIGSILIFTLLALVSHSQTAHALDAEGWFAKGNELSQQGSLEEAIEAYKKSTALNDLSPVAHYNLGIAYKKLQQHEKAVIAFKKTVELEPTHMDARISLGNVYNRLSRWEDAIGQLNIVVHRERNNAEAHGNLGWAYYNYKKGPPFKRLVIINLEKAVSLFEAQDMPEAAEATQKVLNEAIVKFGYNR